MDFFYVDSQYIQYLQTIDSKIPNLSYRTRNKFVCGVVFDINGKQYFSPLSSFNKAQRTNFLILDNDGTPISSLRLSFMMPLPSSALTRLVIANETDIKYRRLLNKELSYIQKHEKDIKKKAKKVYEIGTNPNHVLAKNCCDFKKLETEATQEGFAKFLADSLTGSAV